MAGCSGARTPVAQPASDKGPEPIAIIASESGPQGARLVAIDEHGDRRFDLLQPPQALSRDSHPTISPDGSWIVFASSRGRSLDATSLWIAKLSEDAAPVRITTSDAIESHPAWTRDGRAIVFASTREGGDFDLFRVAIADGHAVGDPEQLTHGEGHEVTPTVARDGTIIYAEVTKLGDEVESHLEARAPDGTITQLTPGPADASPQLTPDDRTLAFARPQAHDSGLDSELWTMPSANAAQATRLIDLPLTDESGPVWSPDGRYLFATSVLRGANGNPLFSSIIVIDTHANPRKARLLVDRTGAVARLTPAIARRELDATALASDPEYLPALARITAAAIATQSQTPP